MRVKNHIEEIEKEIKEGLGCIIFDFGCYFPFSLQDQLDFYFSLGTKKVTDIKLNHRYPNHGYVTISKKSGRKVSKLGYPYFCELGKRNILLELHMGFEDTNINLVFPLELDLNKDKPVCALTFHMNFENGAFSFYSYCKVNQGWKGQEWTSYHDGEDSESVVLLEPPIQISNDTLLYENILTPASQTVDDLMII